MDESPLAGKPAPKELLADLARLEWDYYMRRPDPTDPHQLVSFGTSGHRGTSTNGSFTETHIAAITQAICDYRRSIGRHGPLFMGKDTHALSAPAQRTALEVFAANGVHTMIQAGGDATPTPVISRAILVHNRGRSKERLADGIIITPSHNPPEDGGFKYNLANGGPADKTVTDWVQKRANELLSELLRGDNAGVKRMPFAAALKAATTSHEDFIQPYVEDLKNVVDMEAIRRAGLKLGVDPLGGAAMKYWKSIRECYHLDIEILNPWLDPTFSFVPVDDDGKIRMDCSSPKVMAEVEEFMKKPENKNKYAVAFANDPDADRHGIVTPSKGLLKSNDFLAVAIHYLLTHRQWRPDAEIGKTVVSSSMIDRVAASLGRKLCEVPVGFKWFAPGLFDGTLCFGGEESAGASFLRRDGTVWTTDKDGLIMNLLAAEITAVTGRDPGEYFKELVKEFGQPYYKREDASATLDQKAKLKKLSPDAVEARELADDPIIDKRTTAPGNGAPIEGLKVITANGWFAARPSGTEAKYKIYAESFSSEEHLKKIVNAAKKIVSEALKA